jgi:alpha-methylacyl-CoA racemase
MALRGIRVLDLTRLLPGGFCTMLLADYGADVIKIERLDAGDYLRWAGPTVEAATPSAAGAPFVALNRGKRSVRLDLKHPEGRALLRRLVRRADVLVEGFRPGVMHCLGLATSRGITHRGENRERPRRLGSGAAVVGSDGLL